MKMLVETRVAVDQCVDHWNKIAGGDLSERTGPDSCALCQRFFDEGCTREVEVGGVQELCPVARYTGQAWCLGTPWYHANQEHGLDIEGHAVENTHRTAMRDLLVSLPDVEEFSGED